MCFENNTNQLKQNTKIVKQKSKQAALILKTLNKLCAYMLTTQENNRKFS